MEILHICYRMLKFLQIFGILAIIAISVETKKPQKKQSTLSDVLLRAMEEKHVAADLQRENELAARLAESRNELRSPVYDFDPCEKMHCGAGRICQSNGDTAECICIPDCPQEIDLRRHVCTNKNETWPSDCAVYREKCLCDTNHHLCKSSQYRHIHIEYYGVCKELPECTKDEMLDFPRRMRDWLFNVMRDLAERDELNEYYMKMELEAETNLTRRWSNAAVWKWCDLDGDSDRSVSRHELFPIRAPLISLEHCISPFLDSCDQNNDHRITLQEWGKCLELDEADMVEKCYQLREVHPNLG
ncbi:SPARC isoform X2 [Condylostylus longicornis]|uniref:SPARC isoform X2 n=1 Tax=Condylostylus longicornis TaxID=2530218 RepID=UPI00244DAF54|nr:SPARC isoform X2 [Condylostylus longicornis]